MHGKILAFYDLCEGQINQHGSLSSEHKRTMNLLNDRIQRVVSFADKNCKKARVGKIPFSTEAQRIMGAMRVQKMMLMRIELKGKAGRPQKRRLRRLAKRYKYKGNVAISDHAEVKAFLCLTSNEYAAFRPKASAFRSTYLGRIANELFYEDGISQGVHYRNLIQQEETKLEFRRIKQAEKRVHGGGVSAVEKDVRGKCIRISTKIEMEQEIARVNWSRVLQAHNTPLC